MTGYWIELRRSPLRWWSIPLVAVALGMVLLVGGDWDTSWPQASAAVTRAGLPLMIAALGLTAHRVSSIHRGRNEALLAARARGRLELTSLAADASWLVAVHLTVVGIVWAMMWSRGAPGGPWLEYPLFGVCGVVFAAALGHLLGRLLPGRFTGVLAAVAGYLLFLVIFAESPLSAGVGYQAIGFRLSGTHLGWRLALTAVTVLVSVSAVYLVTRDRRRPLFAVLPAMVLLAGMAAMPSGWDAPPVQQREASGLACADTDSGSEVCVWPEHAHRLPEAAAAADRVSEAAPDALPAVATYREDGLERGGVGGFTLDHGPGDLLATLAGEHLDRALPHCAEWSDEQSAAHASIGLWLDARARGLDTLPGYQFFGDGGDYRAEVEETLTRPEDEQLQRVETWVETTRTVAC